MLIATVNSVAAVNSACYAVHAITTQTANLPSGFRIGRLADCMDCIYSSHCTIVQPFNSKLRPFIVHLIKGYNYYVLGVEVYNDVIFYYLNLAETKIVEACYDG